MLALPWTCSYSLLTPPTSRFSSAAAARISAAATCGTSAAPSGSAAPDSCKAFHTPCSACIHCCSLPAWFSQACAHISQSSNQHICMHLFPEGLSSQSSCRNMWAKSSSATAAGISLPGFIKLLTAGHSGVWWNASSHRQ